MQTFKQEVRDDKLSTKHKWHNGTGETYHVQRVRNIK